MTKTTQITQNGYDIGTAYLLDDNHTFNLTMSGWIIKTIYQTLNSKKPDYTNEWCTWNHLYLRVGVTNDFTPSSDNYLFGQEATAQIKKAFGETVLNNALVIKNHVESMYSTLERVTKNPVTDLDYYKRSVMGKYEEKVMKGRRTTYYPYDTYIIPYAYVKVCPRMVKKRYSDWEEISVADLEFYSKDDRLVARLNYGCSENSNSLLGTYYYEKLPSSVKVLKTTDYILETEVPVMPDMGCIDCKDSEYSIHDGVYLRCTLCGKEVKEIEYDGEHYPEYCNRNIAKKIRTYNEKKAQSSA